MGAGLAGSVLATVLARRGKSVAIVEPRAEYPACFKAEKLEPDQWGILKKLDLLDDVKPACADIHRVQLATGGNLYGEIELRQYGFLYHDLVNQLRNHFPSTLDIRYSKVVDVGISEDKQCVHLADGSSISARLVIIATGGYGKLHAKLGARRRVVSRQHSFNFGFNMVSEYRSFPFDALTYYADDLRSAVDYLTMFRIPDRMRANLFTYWQPNDERIRRFSSSPRETLLALMPKLAKVLDDFDIPADIERRCIDLYVVEPPLIPGVVFLADACQSVCPSTGTGLSKLLADADILLNSRIDQWLSSPGMGADKLAGYYAETRKIAADRHSLTSALQRRNAALERSVVRRRINRIRKIAQMYRLTKGFKLAKSKY